MPSRPAKSTIPAKTTRTLVEVPMSEFIESTNVLIYGLPGCGKTTFSADLPNSFYINAEPGIIAAKRAGSKASVVHVRDFDSAMQVARDCEAGKYDHRDWAIVDTLSTLDTKNLRGIAEKEAALNPRLDPDVPAVQHYLKAQSSLKRFVERMVDLPINCLFLAHAMRVSNDDGDTLWLPSIQGGADKGFPVSNYIMALMNVVGFMSISEEDDEQVYRILWNSWYDSSAGVRYTAKDQYSALGRYSDNTTAKKMAEKLAAAQDTPRKKRAAERSK